jgi:ribosome-associated toxin RatA of RatAB toxin-antitoxin module
MRTVDRIHIAAPADRVFAIAADVERWPGFLPHYRWVRIHERRSDGGIVEMAAWRPFGVLRYPTWWLSEMHADPRAGTVRYRHIDGITRHMDVEWKITGSAGAVDVTVVHAWDGPPWPLIGRLAADWVIGPVFIHAIASRTLRGVKQRAEQQGWAQ